MMRYQRVSPDYNPLSNGSKSSFRCKEDGENDSKAILNNGGGFRFRSPSKQPPLSQENNNNNTSTSASSPLSVKNNNSNSRGGGGVLLQWGHKKRARLSRSEIRSLTDDSSSIHRRGGSPFIDKPPPLPLPVPLPVPLPHSQSQPPNATSTSTRAYNPRTKEPSGFINNRNIEDRSSAANGSASQHIGRGVSSSAGDHSSEKMVKKIGKDEKTNGSLARSDVVYSIRTNTAVSIAEKVNVVEWPKIDIALSKKEKEYDFLAMKGTKLPHRPKKRAKNIDRTLQYCFPGMWLSDITKSRYEVREKKSIKKKKRGGLKGMESMESDSEE